jgi:uncharacterized protein YcfJ
MKYAVIALTLFATPVAADVVYGRVTRVEPIISETYVDVPRNVCYEVNVPVTRRTGATDADVIAGALIGGVIGNQFGGGSGKDAATVLGVILGANAGSKQTHQTVTGYRIEQQCATEYVTEVDSEITGWTVYYKWNNVRGSFETHRDDYFVGDRIRLNITNN